jgi:UDP-GlcNAc:undecaprenyl-phosphate/decaprenyl-phosphate GlcNAc-1-phosphate transferase
VRDYLIVFGVALASAYFATPLVRRLAVRLGAVDIPDDRKVHNDPTPTLGGVALFIALVNAVAVARGLGFFGDVFRTSSEPLGVLGAAAAIVALGVVDDLRGLRASTKLAGQVLAAGILVLAGVQVSYFWLPGVGLLSLSGDLSALITIGWTVALINAVNLIDGLDGLAAGVSTIAALSFFTYAHRASNGEPTTAALLSIVVAGACVGFIRHNFNPARIFMGDSGSMLLGLLLASATVSGVGRTTEPQLADFTGFVIPVLIPFLVLAIPLADAGYAIARRMRGRRPVFHPDKQHIHHWLFEMARSHRGAVLIMYLWSAMLAGSTLALSFGGGAAGRTIAVVLFTTLVATVLIVPRALRGGFHLRSGAARERIHKRGGSLPET